MKSILTCALFMIAFGGRTQSVSGLYSGTLYNDTTKMLQYYQLALSEYKGKITGYSYTTFVRNDSSFYGIRSVKGQVKENKLFVEDDRLLFNNFPEPPAKGVKRLSVISIAPGTDTLASLNGSWATNRTKQYLPVTGSVDLKRDNDSTKSALIGHLKELHLLGNTGVAQKGEPARALTSPAKEPLRSTTTTASVPYSARTNKTIETLTCTGDSLMLSFYDNGVVDGDMISVYANGQALVSNAKLTEAALKKAIPFKSSGDVEILLVAENLGTLPPNTGLLVVHDGTTRYSVTFSADLQTNARIIIKRKN
jgi:hypothetical protein